MSEAGPVTLDLAAIRNAQRAGCCALRKRERESREARCAAAEAREAAARARAAQGRAFHAVDAARRQHGEAVAACANVGHAREGEAPRAGGNELLARVRYCARAADEVAARRAELQEAEHAGAQAQARAEESARAWSRAEQRVALVREQLGAWVAREQLAIEMHGDLALEDEPHRAALGERQRRQAA